MTTSDSTQPEDYTILLDTGEKTHGTLLIIAGILLLLILAGLWLFIPEDEEIELAPPLQQAEIDPIVRAQIETAKQSQNTQGSGEAEASVDTEIASFEAGESEGQTQVASLIPLLTAQGESLLPPGEQARDLIRTVKSGEKQVSMKQLFNEADKLAQTGQGTDAYLLYFYAARKGHGQSAFALAEMNDPAYFKEGNELLEKPDPTQAYKWYSMAAASQVDQAEERLIELRAGVEAAAAAGDLSAQRLLLNWK
ncbi:MAG: hypothetical protein PVG22_08940 [Chromatiales bacterium]|jgi:hypothetical protein